MSNPLSMQDATSPVAAYDSHEEAMRDSIERQASQALAEDKQPNNAKAGRSSTASARGNLNTSSFETDLSSPLRNRNEDRSGVYKSDPKYQKYVQLVERNLQSFDYVSEWADVTAFLTKLSRALEIYSKFAIIPHKETVAKRLAQCLNPALPTGVHQKALNLYAQVFKQIGDEQLIIDLPLYSYGLFPFMRNASSKTKPQLLDLFEEHFIPLGSSLRACMKSFTVGLLPGLEEGSVDVYNRVMKLLDKLRDTVDPSFFFPTMFLIMITNTEQRESALKYLSQRLPVFSQNEDVVQVAGGDTSLMARALASTLTDSKPLVLRAALDLVMTRFPLRTNVLAKEDLVLLMRHAAEVVLKKDMSLNRRLYTWLLGPSESEAEHVAYFNQYAQRYLTEALLGSFAALSSSPDHQHTVLRILIGLVDKPEISQPILDKIFVPLLQLLIAERDSRPDRMLPAKLSSVSRMFVEMLDPIFTWSQIISQLVDSVIGQGSDCDGGADGEKTTRALHLLLFFVQVFELDDDATLHVHLPMALLSILATLERALVSSHKSITPQISCCFTRIAIDIFTRIPKSTFIEESTDEAGISSSTANIKSLQSSELFNTTRSFYSVHRAKPKREDESTEEAIAEDHEHSVEAAKVQRAAAEVVRGSGLLFAITRLSKSIVAQLGLRIIGEAASTRAVPAVPFNALAMEDICHILRTAMAYSHDFLNNHELARCDLPLPALGAAGNKHPDLWVPVFTNMVSNARHFQVIDIALTTLLEFVERKSLSESVFAENGNLTKFVERLWDTLAPETMAYHYRATQLLYQLYKQIDARGVERHLAAKLNPACGNVPGGRGYIRELALYSVFWHNLQHVQREMASNGKNYDPLAFSRLLLLVLDNIAPKNTMVSDIGSSTDSPSTLSRYTASRAWIDASSSTSEWEYIAETLLLLLLLTVRVQRRAYSLSLSIGYTSQRQEYINEFDYGRVSYYIDNIQKYLECASDAVVRAMLTKVPTNTVVVSACEQFSQKGESWLQILVSAAAEFALTDAPTTAVSKSAKRAIEATRARASRLISYLVSRPAVLWPPQFISKLQGRVVDSLLFSVLHRRASIQPPLLDLFVSLVETSLSTDKEMVSTSSASTHKSKVSGIGDATVLPLFSRMVLSALTLQLDTVALRKWVSVIEVCLPYIQQHVAAGSGHGDAHDLMRMLVLPCIHSLRLLLSQCSEYFAKSNGLSVTKHKSTKKQLYKHLLPLFAIPAVVSSQKDGGQENEAAANESMNIDVLTILLDAFDIFLSICLKHADKLPVESSAIQRPSSRASEASVESSNSTTAATSSSLGSIPILKFVSSIFALDDNTGPEPAAESDILGESLADSARNATDTPKDSAGFDSEAFSLVSILAVMRQVWDAFDFSQLQKPSTQPSGGGGGGHEDSTDPEQDSIRISRLVLEDFGISEASVAGNVIHMQRIVHLHITRILETAVSIQPAEVTEAMVALWIRDNPMWINSLDVSPRRHASATARSRRSSISSLKSPMSPTSSHHEIVPATPLPPDEQKNHVWNWQTTDLFEAIPGRSPINVLTTLLNSLHIRSTDPLTPGGMSPVASTASFGFGSDKLQTRFSSLDDIALTRFIELYTRHKVIARSSNPLVPHILSMLKEYNTNAQQNKLMLPFYLRMFTELCERVASNSQSLDPPSQRLYSREMFDAYARMVDNCILIAGRSFDQTNWLRRTNNIDGIGSSGLVIRPDPLAGTLDAYESSRVMSEDSIINQVLSYIGNMVIPQFALLVPDYDRQLGIATNLMHYAVAPALKSHMTGGYSGPAQALTSRSKHFSLVLGCLDSLSRQASLMKVWKREVWDYFSDPKFFPSSTASDLSTMALSLAPCWRHLIRTLLASEKEKFTEVLSKVSSSSSGPALFANREHEAQMRSIALRRLSFVIWAGVGNQYFSSLPQIQEKLVDILKNSPHPAVQIEVFLCLRVLLCRMSNQHMSNFWPMLLTELMRLCLLQLNREGGEEPEQANLFLSACKFLDLLFILGTDDFLVHQWIFITDTIDALYGSRSASYALLDQLSTRLLSMPSKRGRRVGTGVGISGGLPVDTYPKILLTDSDDPTNLVYQQLSEKGAAIAKSLGLNKNDLQSLGEHPRKRPIIRIRSVASIRELDAFVHNASVQAYQAAYTMAEPDMEFIEALLVSDLLYFDFGTASNTSLAMASPPSHSDEHTY